MIKRLAMAPARVYEKPARVLISLLLFACLQVPLLCQSGRTGGPQEEAPLRYRIIVSEPSVCPKQGIKLELELENTSNHRLLIDPKRLFYQVSINGEGRGMASTGDSWGKPRPDQYVALAPGESYRKNVTYPFVENEIFSREGLYTIRLTYGQWVDASPTLPDLYRGSVNSNEVLFEIRDCSDDKP